MSEELVVREARDGGVVVLRVNRPPFNLLSREVMIEFGDKASELVDDAGVKAVVVTGSARVFAAGADVSQFDDQQDVTPNLSEAFRAAAEALGKIPRPVIAAIEGAALGGGLELALACDLLIAGDGAFFGFPEILLGLFPGAGGTQRTTRRIGPARTKDLIWSGRRVQADEALSIGLVNRVVAAGTAFDAAVELASTLGAGAVVAMGLAKQAIDGALDGTLDEGLDLEADLFVTAFDTEDRVTGVRSFLEHGLGKAKFSGR